MINKINKIGRWVICAALFIIQCSLFTSCKDDFLEKLPEGNYTGESYYTSDKAVIKALEPLYNRAWFNFNRRAMMGIGSFRANDAWNPYASAEFARFQTTALTPEVIQAWSSLFTVVTMSNSIIHDLTENVGAEVSDSVCQQGLGEAYLMRATSYFYMVRIWGPTILFEDNDPVVLSPVRPLNTEEDVFKFIIRDYRRAIENLPKRGKDHHPSQYAAKALLAKALLAHSGWNNGGMRRQEELSECISLCQDVIANSGATLLEDFEQLFMPQYNDNEETLLAMRWASPITGGWGELNALVSDLSFSDVCDVNCWGNDMHGSIDMMDLFNEEPGDSMRLRATFFTEDRHYDYIKSAHGGYTYDKKWFQVKKGVVGSKEDVNGELATQASPLNTYIIRLADVYLTLAEACLGNDETLSGGPGLEAFNAIRRRADIPEKQSITFEDIVRERRIEFCMEYCNWFDMVSWYRWKPDYMLDYFNKKQLRGFSFENGSVEIRPDGLISYRVTSWTDENGNYYWNDGLRDGDGNYIMTKEDGYKLNVDSLLNAHEAHPNIVVTKSNVFMPYPEADVLQNHFLREEPQPYDFEE
ncbi:MAG: RagB/SusD family nutrient uptake outer membrane protein [Prevotella sp.]|nr:RagB/SusD family nutrient uptake outer membrane protein [Prevotella sp.]